MLKLDDLYHFKMAKMMCQFIYDKVLFKCNDYFEYSSEASTNITRNLSEKK